MSILEPRCWTEQKQREHISSTMLSTRLSRLGWHKCYCPTLTIILVLSLVLLVSHILEFPVLLREYHEAVPSLPAQTNAVKRILFWTRGIRNTREYGAVDLGRDGFRLAGCPVWQCEAYDAEMEPLPFREEDFEAVVFYEPNWRRRIVPRKRAAHQRYVLWTLESPVIGKESNNDWKRFNNVFNWTMTYREDSDVVYPYGWTTPLRQPAPSRRLSSSIENLLGDNKNLNFAKGKTKLVAWFASDCNASSGRSELVERLQKFISIDVYGKCGSLVCPIEEDDFCRRMMGQTYKFYISFESSLCKDYVTDKFLDAFRYNVVPIVMDAHQHHKNFAPPHSYINALDFPSVHHLANYLIQLDQNDTLYNQYFDWKSHYEVYLDVEFKRGMCNLCSALHQAAHFERPQVYENLNDWWSKRSRCKTVQFKAPKKLSNESNDDFVFSIRNLN